MAREALPGVALGGERLRAPGAEGLGAELSSSGSLCVWWAERPRRARAEELRSRAAEELSHEDSEGLSHGALSHSASQPLSRSDAQPPSRSAQSPSNRSARLSAQPLSPSAHRPCAKVDPAAGASGGSVPRLSCSRDERSSGLVSQQSSKQSQKTGSRTSSQTQHPPGPPVAQPGPAMAEQHTSTPAQGTAAAQQRTAAQQTQASQPHSLLLSMAHEGGDLATAPSASQPFCFSASRVLRGGGVRARSEAADRGRPQGAGAAKKSSSGLDSTAHEGHLTQGARRPNSEIDMCQRCPSDQGTQRSAHRPSCSVSWTERTRSAACYIRKQSAVVLDNANATFMTKHKQAEEHQAQRKLNDPLSPSTADLPLGEKQWAKHKHSVPEGLRTGGKPWMGILSPAFLLSIYVLAALLALPTCTVAKECNASYPFEFTSVLNTSSNTTYLISVAACPAYSNCSLTDNSSSLGSYCQCLTGFTSSDPSTNLVTCSNVDECADGHNCDVNADCTDTLGSFTCACRQWAYTGDGVSCGLTGACETGADNCVANSSCVSTQYGANCTCNAGFVGNATDFCFDIDECATDTHNCSQYANCTNTFGSYTCNCSSGFTQPGDGSVCDDIPECTLDLDDCDSNADCSETPGSFSCQCHNWAYTGLGINNTCLLTGACETGQDDCHPGRSTCISTEFNWTCSCNAGWMANLSAGGSPGSVCSDVDECALGTHDCDENAICNNTVGSFTCECNMWAYTGEGTNGTCVLTGLCETDQDYCDSNANCTSGNASFTCACNDGYQGSGYDRTAGCNTNFPFVSFLECDQPTSVTKFCVEDDTSGADTCTVVFNETDGLPDNENLTLSFYVLDVDFNNIGETLEVKINGTQVFIGEHVGGNERSFSSACPSTFEQDPSLYWFPLGERYRVDQYYAADGEIRFEVKASSQVGGRACVQSPDIDTGTDQVLFGVLTISWGTALDPIPNATSVTHGCVDIDECSTGTHNCHRGWPYQEDGSEMGVCSNTNGSFTCACATRVGYTDASPVPGPRGLVCDDIDECATGTHNCSINADCTNTNGSYICTCRRFDYIEPPGGDGTVCVATGDCVTGNDNCHPGRSICTSTNGSFFCNCSRGWQGDGVNCVDIDECNECIHNCDEDALCNNTAGSFLCACDSAYTGNGTECQDKCSVDDANNCHDNATCIVLHDDPREDQFPPVDPAIIGFDCECNTGFQGNGTFCEDVTECFNSTHFHTCDGNATCTDTFGSFVCTCNGGYEGDGLSCSNVKECDLGLDNCDENANCFETDGSFGCSCRPGWIANGTGDGNVCENVDECVGDGSLCLDIDECTLPYPEDSRRDNCARLPGGNRTASCNNTAGSFTCTCNDGYRLGHSADGVTCPNDDECALGIDDCFLNASCTDTTGSFICTCNTGFFGNGTSCRDVDECAGPSNCPSGAACFNTYGSFFCVCDFGFEGSNAFNCSACPPGKFKDVLEFSNCTACPENTYNSFRNATKLSNCLACPLNSTAPIETTSFDGCLCNPGFFLNETQTCEPCVAGTYKETYGPEACAQCAVAKYSVTEAASQASTCQDCPLKSESPTGSDELTDCKCEVGHTGVDGEPCTACVPGFYKEVIGSSECQICPPNTFQEQVAANNSALCLACTANSISPSGSGLRSNCSCLAGYGFESDFGLCKACLPGFYKDSNKSVPCTACPDGAQSPLTSTAITDCTCSRGFVGTNGGECTICGANFFKNTTGPGICYDCPANSVSDAGSQTILQCACDAGYQGPNGQPCTACAAGKYKPFFGSDDCSDCFARSSSNPGSVQESDCFCNVGYQKPGNGEQVCNDINECVADTHNCDRSRATCTNTEGSFSCACNQFFQGNGTHCTPQTVELEFSIIVQGPDPLVLDLAAYEQAIAFLASVLQSTVAATQTASSQRRLLSSNSTANTTLVNQTIFFNLHLQASQVPTFTITLNITNLNAVLSSFNLPLSIFVSPLVSLAQCGNGVLQNDEECDDGNQNINDGCNQVCEIELGWNCSSSGSAPPYNASNPESVCVDLNECSGSTTCHNFANCINTPGSYFCQCFLGFVGNGSHCQDDPTDNATLQRPTEFQNDFTALYVGSQGSGFGRVLAFHRAFLLVGSLSGTEVRVYQRQGEAVWPSTHSAVLSCSTCGKFGIDLDVFGSDVASETAIAVVGTNNQMVKIFERSAGTWNVAHPTTLTKPNELFFGTAVAVNQNEVLVGAYGANKAYLYQKTGNLWLESVVFDQSTGESFFGHLVDLNDEMVVIASLYVQKIHVFATKNMTIGLWNSTSDYVLTVNIQDASEASSMSISGSSIFVGAPGQQTVFIFQKAADGTWPSTPSVTLTVDNGQFGFCVGNTDLYAVMGAFTVNEAYIYKTFPNGTWNPSPIQIIAPGSLPSESLGYSCMITNHDIVLSSYSDDRVYIHSASCQKGYYGYATDYCSSCPENAGSEIFSKTIEECVCSPGWYSLSNDPKCIDCPRNFYCTGGNLIPCPEGKVAKNSSKTVQDCTNAQFVTRTIVQSNSQPFDTNILNVTLEANIDLLPSDGVLITISGLICGSGGCSICGFNSDILNVVTLNPVGQLVMHLNDNIVAFEPFHFSFCVVNQEPQYPPSIFIEASGLRFNRERMDSGRFSQTALGVTGFVDAIIVQSSPAQDSLNLVTVTLKMYASIPDVHQIIITGLTGAVPGSAVNLSLTSTDSAFSHFDSMSLWEPSDGKLTISVREETLGNYSYVFQFNITNGASNQPSPSVSIKISNFTREFSEFAMSTGEGNSAILLIAGFARASMRQSTFLPLERNVLTLSFASNLDLKSGTTFIVSGLAGAAFAASEAPAANSTSLTANNSPGVNATDRIIRITPQFANSSIFGPFGIWSDEGKLTLGVLNSTVPGFDYQFSFTVQNPALGQESPSIFIETTGLRISPTIVTPASGNEAPLLVSGFRSKIASQNTTCPGSENVLTFDLNLLVGLPFLIPGTSTSYSSSTGGVQISGIRGLFETGTETSSGSIDLANCGDSYVSTTIDIRSNGTSSSNASATVALAESSASFECPNGRSVSTTSSNSSSGGQEAFVESWASWQFEPVEGTLTVDLKQGKQLIADANYSLQVLIVNSLVGQDTPAISISGLSASPMSRTVMDFAFGDFSPLRILGFKDPLITQATPIPGLLNQITVVFQLFGSVPRGTEITIAGLTGGNTSASSLYINQGMNVSAADMYKEMNLINAFARSPTWDNANGRMVLVANETLPGSFSNVTYLFSFDLLNPNEGQDPPPVNLSASHGSECAGALAHKLIPELLVPTPSDRNQAPLLIASFEVAKMSQSNASVDVENVVTLELTSRVDLLAGSTITISGLECSQCGICVSNPDLRCCELELNSITVDGNLSSYHNFSGSDLNSDSAIFLFSLTGLDEEKLVGPVSTGTDVVLVLNKPIQAHRHYVIKYLTYNNDCGQDGSSSIFISARSPPNSQGADAIQIINEPVDVAPSPFIPFQINWFPELVISQTNTAVDVQNSITVKFSTRSALQNGTRVVVSGLSKSVTPTGPIDLTGKDVSAFERAEWDEDEGTLTLITAQNGTESGKLYEVSFELQNPPVAQESPVVYIQAFDRFGVTSIEEMDKGIDKCLTDPLAVVDFVVKDVGQSSPLPGDNNTITVTFGVSEPFDPSPEVCNRSIFILLSGVIESETPDNKILPVQSYGEAVGVLALNGSWTKDTGSLLVQVLDGVCTGKSYVFSFNLLNRLLIQGPARVFIQTLGVVIAPTLMNNSAGLEAPMLVQANFTKRVIGQSTASINTTNTIGVTLGTQFGIVVDPFVKVTVSGLTGAATEDGNLPVEIAVEPPTTTLPSYLNITNQSVTTNLWETVAPWTKQSGSIVFASRTRSVVLSQQSLVIKFNLTNPGRRQSSPDVSLQVPQLLMPWEIMDKAPGNNAPLEIAGILRACIRQTTPSQGATNRLTWGFQASVNLLNGTVVRLSGLAGTGSADAMVPVTVLASNSSLNCTMLTDGLSNTSELFESSSFKSKGVFNQTRGTLDITFSAEISFATAFIVSFDVKNRKLGRDPSAQVLISGHEALRMAPFEAEQADGNFAPLLVAGFRERSIGQSDTSQGRTNTITITFHTNVALEQGSLVSIMGLTGTSTSATDALDLTIASDSPLSQSGSWDPQAGQLTFSISTTTEAFQDYMLSFELTNPLRIQSSPSISIASSGTNISADFMEPGAGNAAPLLVAGFLNNNITQTTPAQSVFNVIHVTLKVNVDILATDECDIVIWGLTGSAQEQAVHVNDTTDGGQRFEEVAMWSRESGTLRVRIIDTINANADFSFSFGLMNPANGQESPPVSVQMLGAIYISPVEMTKAFDIGSPLLITSFVRRDIQQSTPSALATNTITVQLSTTIEIPKSSNITITGLSGPTASDIVSVQSSCQPQPFFPVAQWNQNTSTIVIRLSEQFIRNVSHEISFDVTNPAEGQYSPSISIQVDHYQIVPIDMLKAPGNDAPLLIADFLTKQIAQSDPSNGVINTISVTFESRVDLKVDTTITISGLTGSSTTNEIIPVRAVPLQLLEFTGKLEDTALWNGTSGVLVLTVSNTSVIQSFDPPQIVTTTPVPNNETNCTLVNVTIWRNVSRVNTTEGNFTNSTYQEAEIVQELICPNVTNSTGEFRPENLSNMTNVSNSTANVLFSSNYTCVTGRVIAERPRVPALVNHVKYLVEFNLTNPLFGGQFARTTTIQSSNITIVPGLIEAPTENTGPLLIAGFITKKIGQSTPSANQANTITTTLSMFHTLKKDFDTITIFGLENRVAPSSGPIAIQTQLLRRTSLRPLDTPDLGTQAVWNLANGTLVISVFRDTIPDADYIVAFGVTNPGLGQDAPVLSISVNGNVITKQAMVSDPGNEAPMLVADFLKAKIGQSTPSSNAVNTITCTFQTRAALLPGTMMTITGLTGSVTLDNAHLPLNGSAAESVLARSGAWTKDNGRLIVRVNQESDVNVTYELKFDLNNPAAGQNSPVVAIETNQFIFIQKINATRPSGNNAPLQIPFWITQMTSGSAISQRIPHVDALNTIDVTLGINFVTIPAGTDIILSGLTGSATPSSNNVNLLESNPFSTYVSAVTPWNQEEGSITVHVIEDVDPTLNPLLMSFKIRNPSVGQEPTTVSIEMSGALTVLTELVSMDVANAAPLRVAQFLEKHVSQNNLLQSAPNEISMRISTSVRYEVVERPYPFRGVRDVVNEVERHSLYVNFDSTQWPDLPTFNYWIEQNLTGTIPITSSPPGVVDLVGTWQPNAVLKIPLLQGSTWEAFTQYNISFTMPNPPDSIEDPQLYVKLNGDVQHVQVGLDPQVNVDTIRYTPMDKAPGLDSPFVLSSLVMKRIGQSTPNRNMTNTITVTLISLTECPASRSCALTIRGLRGSDTPSTGNLNISVFRRVSNSDDLVRDGVFSDTADWNQGTGQLILVAAQDVQLNEEYQIKFELQNPKQGHDSPEVFIGSVELPILFFPVVPGEGNAAPLLVADVLMGEIEHETTSAGQMNTILVNLTIRADLVIGTNLTISGLKGTITESTSNLSVVVSSSGMHLAVMRSYWNRESGTLIMPVSRTMIAQLHHELRFVLQNPFHGQDPAENLFVETHGIIEIPRFELNPGLGDKAPLLVADFLLAAVGQSTVSQRAQNTISVTFAVRATLPVGSSIVVSGLANLTVWESEELQILKRIPIFGNFSTSIALRQYGTLQNGHFTVVTNSTPPATVFELKWDLTNPSFPRRTHNLSLSSIGNVYIPPTSLLQTPGNTEALLTIGFVTSNISQSNPQTSQANTFTVIFSTNAILVQGTRLIISELLRANSSGSIAASVVGQPSGHPGNFISATATHDSRLETAYFTIIEHLIPNELYSFNFTLINPATGQQSPMVMMAADTAMNITSIHMSRAAGLNAPLIVRYSFQKFLISHSTTVPGAPNRIFLTIESKERLLTAFEVSITISGLVSTNTSGLPGACGESCIAVLSGNCSGIGPVRKSAPWNQTTGTLVLSFVNEVAEFDPVALYFDLENPLSGQRSPNITVEVSGVPVLPFLAEKAPGNFAPLLTAGFVSASAEQNRHFVNANNTISIFFSSSVSIKRGSLITVEGLIGFATADTNFLAVCGENSSQVGMSSGPNAVFEHEGFCGSVNTTVPTPLGESDFNSLREFNDNVSSSSAKKCHRQSEVLGPFARWNAATGTLILRVHNDSHADVEYGFSVVLQNGVVAKPGVSRITIKASGVFLPELNVSLGVGSKAPGLVVGWSEKSIGQTTHRYNEPNSIMITLSCSADILPDKSNVTVSLAFPNTNDLTDFVNQSFAVSPNTFVYSPGRWNPDTSSLILTMKTGLVKDQVYVVALRVTNPTVGRDAPLNITVAAFTEFGLALPPEPMTFAVGNTAPFLVLDFSTAVISQSNAGVNSINTVTLTLSSRAIITGSYRSRVVVEGLTGSSTSTVQIQLLSGDQYFYFGSVGRWTQSTGQMILTLWDGNIEANQDIVVAFNLVNGAEPQAGRTVLIHTEYFNEQRFEWTQMSRFQTMESANGINSPLLLIGFSSTVLTQSSASPGQNNSLLLELSTSSHVTDLQSIVLSGLSGLGITAGLITVTECAAPAQLLVQQADCEANSSSSEWAYVEASSSQDVGCNCSAETGQKTSEGCVVPCAPQRRLFNCSGVELIGSWQSSSTITIPLSDSNWTADENHTFLFTVHNGDVSQQSPSNLEVILSSAQLTIRSEVTKAGGDSAPLKIMGWTSKGISQSTSAPGALNTITATVSASGALLQGTTMIMRGFSNALLPTNASGSGNIPVVGNTYLDSEACWTSESGILVLNLASTVPMNTEFSIVFNVTNPTSGQAAPSISIEATGATAIGLEAMESASGNMAPLLVTGFSTRSISQSSAVPGARNQIRIRFATYAPLRRSEMSKITITGLSGVNPLRRIPLVSHHDDKGELAKAFGSEAVFDGTTLALEVQEDTRPGHIYDFSFELQNPLFGREAANVQIGSHGSHMAQDRLSPGIGNEAPLLIAGFVTKDVGQTSSAQSAQNTILITLSTTVSLPTGTEVAIFGLVGSVTADSTALELRTLRSPKAGAPDFSPLATWNRQSGKLILLVDHETSPSASYVLAVTLRNPTVQQDGPEVIEISASGPVPIPATSMRLGSGDNRPLLVAGFLYKQLQLVGSGPVAGPSISALKFTQLSKLVLTFQANVVFPAGSRLLLQGLDFNSTSSATDLSPKFYCAPTHIFHGQLVEHQNAAVLFMMESTEANELYHCELGPFFMPRGFVNMRATIQADLPEISAVTMDLCSSHDCSA